MFDELPFLNDETATFEKGASVFCYTDGITELENESGEFFGAENLHQFISEKMASGTLKEFHGSLINHLDKYRQDSDYSDDVTILSLRALA